MFNDLNVVPVSISYEKDPNDLLKTRELYLTSINTSYEKEPREDLISIADGIKGRRGMYISRLVKRWYLYQTVMTTSLHK